MAEIQEIFFLPPMAIARLGGSATPLASFRWEEDPSLHGAGQTVILPEVSLAVQPDGSIRPFRPCVIQFRDGELFRPVAPFFELWVRTAEGEAPMTSEWLEQQSGSLANLIYTVTAANRKAERRTQDPLCGFSATIQVRGNDNGVMPLQASSPKRSGALVKSSAPIALGSFQVIRPAPGTAMDVDLSVLRVRFTPASGQVYGPSTATTAPDETGRIHELVPPQKRILNPSSSWSSYSDTQRNDNPEPSDTYDGADTRERENDNRIQNQSYGVVDDTCDALIEAALKLGGKTFRATARVFSAPPDFAPDRRPFASLADELFDRDPVSFPDESIEDAMLRIGDLFQRAYETASLANLDMMRSSPDTMGAQSTSDAPAFSDLPKITARESMTLNDKGYFDPNKDIYSPPSADERLPLASVAQQVHGAKADTDDLEAFLRSDPDRIKKMVRPAYARLKDLDKQVDPRQHPNEDQRDPRIIRDRLHDMRMPPYMRDSDATALSLTRTQYEFLMSVVKQLRAQAMAAPAGIRTSAHVARVVERRKSAESGVPAEDGRNPAADSKPEGQG